MQIVQKKAIAVAEVFAKCRQFAQAHGLNEAVGKILGGDITQVPLRIALPESGIDSFEQMGFTCADRPEEDQWDGSLAGLLDDV